MENGPFDDVFPIENGIFQPAMLVYQRVGISFPVINVLGCMTGGGGEP